MPFDPLSSGPTGLADPDDKVLACALPGCEATFRMGDAHNLGHVYLHAAGQEPPRQCADIEHFCCSHEHAVEMAQACLHEHEHAPTAGIDSADRWTHPALAADVACDHADCGAVLAGTDAHAIAVVYRMPGPGFAAMVCGIYLGCSEEHAKQAAARAMRDAAGQNARHPSRRHLTPNERQAWEMSQQAAAAATPQTAAEAANAQAAANADAPMVTVTVTVTEVAPEPLPALPAPVAPEPKPAKPVARKRAPRKKKATAKTNTAGMA